MFITKMRASVATAVAAGALLVAGAGSASAAPAHWSATSGGWLAGSNITFTLNNALPRTCSSFAFTGSFGNSATTGYFNSTSTAATCPGGTQITIPAASVASTDGTSFALTFSDPGIGTFDNLWTPTTDRVITATVPFTNGSPSYVTFNNTPIARQATGGIIRMTGTLRVVGAPLTLVP